MENGPRQKPPPIPPGAFQPRASSPSPAPSSEGIMRQSGVPTRLMELTRGLLPESARDKLFVDMAGNVLVGTTKIGVQEKGRFLIDNFSLFSGISFPPAMRTMAQAKKMVVFIEVTETEASICAGSVLGQKILHSRLG